MAEGLRMPVVHDRFILGRTGLWKSRSAIGPWTPIAPNVYEGLMVPKVAPFHGNRRIVAGFLWGPGWGCCVAIRELVQDEDGTLGTKFVPEARPPAGAPAHLAPLESGDYDLANCSMRIDGGTGFRFFGFERLPADYRLTLRAEPEAGVEAFGVCVRGSGDYAGGCELRLEPGRERVQYGKPSDGAPALESEDHRWLAHDFAIDHVKDLDKPLALEILVRGDLVDTCIGDRRTLITRRHEAPTGRQLLFFARGGAVTFRDIEVRPLLPDPVEATLP